MTGGALTNNAVVVNTTDGRPGAGAVTVLAQSGAADMFRTFAFGSGTVMAATAAAGNTVVIEAGTGPVIGGGVAILAGVVTGNVIAGFSRGDTAVVAGKTTADDIAMLQLVQAFPGVCIVAAVTVVGCSYVL
jgi:hypothetical protein